MGTKELEILQTSLKSEIHLSNPFPGLRPFGFEESHLFFGREGQSDDILDKMSRNRFIAVIGASGSGKSSLMFCGILPVLYGGFLGPAGSEWIIINTRPGNSPIENLTDAIVNITSSAEDFTPAQLETEKLITNIILRSSTYGIADVMKPMIRKKRKPVNILLMIDQFEELFRFIKSGRDLEVVNESSAFVHLILKSVKQTELPIYAAITMRSDFIGDCSQFPELTNVINKSHYLIPQMTRDQQRMAIEGPVAVGGGKITKRLVQQLLNDVGNNPDQLPILQHALMRTWDYWLLNREENEPIDTRHYVAIGKLEEALSMHANETYAELDKKERDICEVIFKSLTEKGRDNFGIRRSATIRELSQIASVQETDIVNVVEKFRKPGRSLLMPPSTIQLKSNTNIEISHESLMRIWDRLKNWVDEEHESAQMYRRLSDAASMYQVGRTGLWRPPDLQLALNWRKKQQPTRAWAHRYNPFFERAILFLETSQNAYENEQKSKELLQKNMLRRTRNVAVLLGVATVVSIVFLLFAMVQKIAADEKAALAQRNALQVGRERELALFQAAESKRLAIISINNEEKAILATNEAFLQRDYAERQRLYAETQTAEAKRQSDIAESRRLEAVTAREQADEARLVAETNQRLANRLLYLSTSQNMAIKALQEQDREVKGLMAQQAYLFNLQYEGNYYDRYIYEGLYSSVKSLTSDTVYSMKKHSGTVRDVAVTSDGKSIFSAGTDGRIIQWASSHPDYSGRELYGTSQLRYRMARLTSDNRWLILATDLPEISCYDLAGGRKKPVLVRGHEGTVVDIAVLPNDKYFISLGSDRTLRINDFVNSQLLRKLDRAYIKMALSPDGKYLVLAGEDGRIVLLETKNIDSEVEIRPGGKEIFRSLAFSPSGNLLAAGNIYGRVVLYDVSLGINKVNLVNTLPGHGENAYINDIKFSPDGKFLATAGFDGIVQLWTLENLNNLPIILRDHQSQVWSLAFSPDNLYLYAGCENGNIKVWPVQPSILADQICGKVNRNMTTDEWLRYVGKELPYEQTCRIIHP